MALNFTVSYTFSPSTTISSSQVNTNTSDVASVFQGLEAVTKSFARLQVDAVPTVAADVVRKDYVDHYSAYRRPVLVYNSGTVVNIESGLDGTSGDVTILFTDGSIRTDSTTGRVQCNLAQVAALSGSWQSGLRTGSVAANTRYAIYAVKTTDNSSHFVAVADVVFPTQANFSTLNSNFGTNGWVFLGYVFAGNGLGGITVITPFVQTGNLTVFNNTLAANALTGYGVLLAGTGGATTLSYAYAAGSSSVQIPDTIGNVIWAIQNTGSTATYVVKDSGSARILFSQVTSAAGQVARIIGAAIDGIACSNTATNSIPQDIILAGFWDKALGVGSNPIL